MVPIGVFDVSYGEFVSRSATYRKEFKLQTKHDGESAVTLDLPPESTWKRPTNLEFF